MALLHNQAPVSGPAAQPRRLTMLALLARAGPRGLAREKVLSLLWPDAEEERGRRSLASALSALRRDLGNEDVFLGIFDLRLNPDVVSSDVAEFEAALAQGNFERAATLYGGPFLDCFRIPGLSEFERWTETERASLANEYQVALERLAGARPNRAITPSPPAGGANWPRRIRSMPATPWG